MGEQQFPETKWRQTRGPTVVNKHTEKFQALLAYQIARWKKKKNLGVIRDSELTYMTHLKKLKKS